MTPIIATEEARKGFYPTPPALAKKLLEGIELDWTNSILEPSAGTGSLIMAFADQVYEKYYHGSFGRCDLNVDCCEIDAGLRGILTDNFSGKAREKTEQDVKDFEKVCYDRDASPYDEPEYDVLCKSEVLLRNIKLRVVNDDFLSYDTFKPYDLIVMNPPFANGDKHLLKAISMQERTGGKIRCILNAEMIRNPYTRSRQELVRKLSELNAEISFETDAFGNAERKTDVEVAIIKLDIPEPHRESDIFKNCLKAETQKMAQAQESTELVFSDKIKQTVAYYRAEIAAGVKLIEEYTALKPYIMSSVKKSEYAQPLITLAVGSDSASDKLNIESYCQAVRSKYWRALFMNPEFTQQLTSEIQSDLRSRVDEMKDLEFSEYNIRTLYNELNVQMFAGVEESIMKLFDTLTVKHTWNEAIEDGNVHYYNGWRTNKAYMIGKKVIIPWHGYIFGYSWNNQKYIYAYAATEFLSDIEKALNYLDGNMTAEIDLYSTLYHAEKTGQTRKIPCKYFKATFYKKGTVHLEFICPELIDRFNIFCSQKKGWLLPSYGRKKYQDMDAEEAAVIDSFHGDGSSGSGKDAYTAVLVQASYYLAPPNQNMLALPDVG